MLATLIIVFREVIEAGLIVSIVLSATRGVTGRGAWVAYGIVAGVFGACIVASFARVIAGALEGYGQEWFNVSILCIAVCMLAWHNVWMARHGRDMAVHMREVGGQVASGSRTLMALSTVVAVAVLREGSEVVLFVYGIAVSGQDSTAMMIAGALGGIALGAAMSAVMYLGLVKVPVRRLFKVTSGLIALLAAGMAAQAAALLQQAQVVTILSEVVWNSSGVIGDRSIAGKVLHTLIGYTAHPTALQLIVYAATLAIIFTLMRLFGQVPQTKAGLPGTASA